MQTWNSRKSLGSTGNSRPNLLLTQNASPESLTRCLPPATTGRMFNSSGKKKSSSGLPGCLQSLRSQLAMCHVLPVAGFCLESTGLPSRHHPISFAAEPASPQPSWRECIQTSPKQDATRVLLLTWVIHTLKGGAYPLSFPYFAQSMRCRQTHIHSKNPPLVKPFWC